MVTCTHVTSKQCSSNEVWRTFFFSALPHIAVAWSLNFNAVKQMRSFEKSSLQHLVESTSHQANRGLVHKSSKALIYLSCEDYICDMIENTCDQTDMALMTKFFHEAGSDTVQLLNTFTPAITCGTSFLQIAPWFGAQLPSTDFHLPALMSLHLM